MPDLALAAKALNDNHGAAPAVGDSGTTCTTSQEPQHRTQGHAGYGPTRVVIPREQVSQPFRQAQDPLPHWYVGEDMIDCAASTTFAGRPSGDHRSVDKTRGPYTRRRPVDPVRRRRTENVRSRRPGIRTARKSRDSCSTNLGSPSPSRSDAACARKVSKWSRTIKNNTGARDPNRSCWIYHGVELAVL